jgi:hypothetical protein
MKPPTLPALLSACALLATSPAMPAAPLEDPALQTLLRQLEARDAVIRDLQQRVTQLENKHRAAPSPEPPPPAPAPDSAAVRGTTQPGVGAAAFGAMAVDEAAAERALERSLTSNGALLLPAGLAEVQFNGSFARSEQSAATLVSVGGQAGIGDLVSRRNDFVGSVSARFGLPRDSQLELSLPYRRSSQTLTEPVSLTQVMDSTQRVSGWEDFTLGLATTLRREQGSWPDVIGRVSWNTGSGDDGAFGTRFPALRGGLTVLKRQDPLVFTGNVFLESARARQGIQPGRQAGLSVAALLAASPQTSLSVGLDQVLTRPVRVDGLKVPGSGQLSSMLTLGSTSTLGRRSLLSVTLGIGLTKDAPNYVVGVALPIRFEFLK